MKEPENATTQELDQAPGETPETGSDDPLDISAADLLGLEEQETDANEEPESAEEPETDEEEGDEDGEEGDEPTEDEDEEDEFDVPSLDAQIKDALKDNPELTKRWESQWKGLMKREAKQKEWEEGITSLFSDPEYARETIPTFLQRVAAAHGTTLEELLGSAQASNELQPPNPDDFATYDEQIEAYKGYLEQKVERETAQLRRELEAMKAEQAKQAKEAEQQKVLDQTLGKVQRVFEKQHQGFKVTRKMLAEAVQRFPNLDAVEAVKAANVDALLSHRSKVVAKAGRVDAPVMMKGGTGKGTALPSDPLELKASMLLGMD